MSAKSCTLIPYPQGADIWVMFKDGWSFEGYSPLDVGMSNYELYWRTSRTFVKAVPIGPNQYTQEAYTYPLNSSQLGWSWTLYMYTTAAY
jgi:hypothetical protein